MPDINRWNETLVNLNTRQKKIKFMNKIPARGSILTF